MPKISKYHMYYRHKGVQKNTEVQVMYNQKFIFYVKVPDEMAKACRVIGRDKRDNLCIEEFNRKTSDSPETDYVICGGTESKCEENTRDAYAALSELSAVEKNVIIVLFENQTTTFNRHSYNNEHPQLAIKFGLTYAVETEISGSKEYTVEDSFKNRKILSLWNSGSTIIPDTEDNRESLELIYEALKTIHDRLEKFTESSEAMVKMIQNNVKLLA